MEKSAKKPGKKKKAKAGKKSENINSFVQNDRVRHQLDGYCIKN